MIGESLLVSIRKGDPDAIDHFKKILSYDGVIEKDEVFTLQLATVSAALALTGKGKGAADRKLGLYLDIFDKLSSVRTAHLLGGDDGLKAIAGRLMEEGPDETAKAWIYDKLLMLALTGPEGDKEGLTAGRDKLLQYIEGNLYSPVIQVGAMLAKAERGELRLDPEATALAGRCLLNAVKHGSEEASGYAVEAIGLAGDEGSRLGLMNHLLDIVEFGGMDEKQKALGALLKYYNDDEFVGVVLHEMGMENGEIKSNIANAAKSEIPGVSETAGAIMGRIRTDDEREQARSDHEFLLETEYPHEHMAQRLYVELIFRAVATVMGPSPRTAEEAIEHEAALMQLATTGADPRALNNLFTSRNDQHNLKIITRNVENALLYALNNGRSREAMEQAAEGLEKIGSERVADILDRIATRHGNENAAGEIASKTADLIRAGWLVESVDTEPKQVRLPPKPPGIPQPLSQRPRLAQ